jgi:hypothetical protein
MPENTAFHPSHAAFRTPLSYPSQLSAESLHPTPDSSSGSIGTSQRTKNP